MPRVLVAGKLHPKGLDLLRKAPDVTVDYVEDTDPSAYEVRLPEADGLLLRTQALTADLVATAPKLAIVSRHGVGYDAVDVAALNARKIPLAIVGDVNSSAVAEHAMMMMLACAKRAVFHQRSVHEGAWQVRNDLAAGELEHKTVLIVGYGRIGRKLASRAGAFDMRILAHDPFMAAGAIEQAGAEPMPTLEDGLRQADFVSLHLPKAGSEPVLGKAELAMMKPTAILINTARGGLVDETALAEALAAGQLAGAGLDVLEAEPPPADHPLLAFEQVLLSPHIGGLTDGCGDRMAVKAAQNILDLFADRLDRSLVVNADAIGLP